jgi:phage-related protein
MHGEVRSPPFSKDARIEAGMLLRRLQRGEVLWMPQSRPMPSIGAGCHELRITDENAIWRIIYSVEPDAIVVLDVFRKKTSQTPTGIVKACKGRVRQYRAV